MRQISDHIAGLSLSPRLSTLCRANGLGLDKRVSLLRLEAERRSNSTTSLASSTGYEEE